MRRLAGFESGFVRIPYATTTLDARRRVIRHRLTEVIFAGINAYLVPRGITRRLGTPYRGTARNRIRPKTRFAQGNLFGVRSRLVT